MEEIWNHPERSQSRLPSRAEQSMEEGETSRRTTIAAALHWSGIYGGVARQKLSERETLHHLKDPQTVTNEILWSDSKCGEKQVSRITCPVPTQHHPSECENDSPLSLRWSAEKSGWKSTNPSVPNLPYTQEHKND